MDGGSRQTRNVGQQMVLGVMGKVVGLSHCQVWADRHICFGAKCVSDPADPTTFDGVNLFTTNFMARPMETPDRPFKTLRAPKAAVTISSGATSAKGHRR
jgi:hypothetical protein